MYCGVGGGGSCEASIVYDVLFRVKKGDMGSKNTYFWDVNIP